MARLVVVSAPSGAGKTTVIGGAREQRPDWLLSRSSTTRQPRAGEIPGVHYDFVTSEEFGRREADGAFLETAIVHGARYGTPREPVERALRDGATMLLEIDVQGARSVRRAVPEALLIFIEPPSAEVLRARLEQRGTESPEALARRLRNAEEEMASAGEFDHRIVNDDLEDAIQQLIAIIEGSEAAPPPGNPPKENL